MHETPTAIPLAGLYDRRSEQRQSLKGEQLTAVTASDSVIALSAGAGSGKTTVLVERFLHLVNNCGVSPLGILAITYTEKAAAEMKERVVRRFAERGDDSNRRRSEAAYISTIHGFCARLLRENPLAAGVDPAFGIVDDMRLGFFMDQERERMLNDEWFLRVRSLFSPRFNSRGEPLFDLVRDCVLSSREFGTGIPDEESFDVEGHVALALRRLDTYTQQLWEGVRSALLDVEPDISAVVITKGKSAEQHSRACEMLAMLPELDAPDRRWAAEFLTVTGFTRVLKDDGARIRAAFSASRDGLKALGAIDRSAEELLEREQIAPLKVGVYRHARELRERYERMKSEHSLLDFEDLQRSALRLLTETSAGSEYSGRFTHILLDEAQDTNQVQKQLIDALERGSGRSIFAVGDVKQSIYGFRGADVTLFGEMHRAAGSGKLRLQDNYRSRVEILDFVNEVGAQLWDRSGEIEYTPLIPKLPYMEVSTPQSRVQVMLVDKTLADPDAADDDVERSEAVHERAALAIAGRIRAMVQGAGGTPPLTVYDRHDKTYRTARYGDIAILANRRTHFATYERVLGELGIPVIADGGRGFFSGREVQDLLAALRVVANPWDEIALLAALRSPLFGWSDEDLVRLRKSGPRDLWRACAEGFAPDGTNADATAYETLSALRRVAGLLPPVRLLQLLLERTAYIAALLRTTRGRAAAANVQKLLEFARSSAQLDGPDLRRFIRRTDLAKEYLTQEREASVAAEGEDVVLLGTIHGSKGLEWPVVILADLESDYGRSATGSCYSAADQTLILQPKGGDGKPLQPASQRLSMDAQKRRAEQEGRRLFYVGMTRAREYLILSGVSPRPTKSPAVRHEFGSPIKWVWTAAGLDGAPVEDCDTHIGSAQLGITHVSEEAVAGLLGSVVAHDPVLAAARRAVEKLECATWELPDTEQLARITAAVRDLANRDAVPTPPQTAIAHATVTQLVYFNRCPLVYYFNLVLQIEEHPRKRRQSETAGAAGYSAVELGAVVHEMLERANFDANPTGEARRLVNEQNPDGMTAGDRERVEKMLVSVLADPLIDRARQAGRLEREYPFLLNVDGTLVRGVIDLVFSDVAGRGVVVDYKSNDLAAPDRVNVLSRYYRPQVEMYALAASRAGLVQPSEATLYFLNKSVARSFPITPGRLESTEREMGDVLARISRGAWDTEPGEKCRNCGYRKRGYCEVGSRFVE